MAGRLASWWRGLSPGARVALGLLVLVALACVGGLFFWGGDLGGARLRISERVASGKPVPYHYYLPVWGFYACVANLGICLFFAVFVGWWGGRDRAPHGASFPRLPNVALASALAAVLVAAWLNVPRLGHSLWGDEERSMKESVVGRYQWGDGGLAFREVSWRDVFFGYKSTNNHILFSAAAKVSHGWFHRPSDAPGETYFSEWALRLPAFLAGLLALPALAWAAQMMGLVRAAPWAPWILVGHAWFTRYSTDARGYGFVILLVVLAAGLAAVAVADGRWRWWVALAACSFGLLYTNPGSVYLVGLLHVAVFWVLWGKARRLAWMGRWLVPLGFSAMLFLQLFAPCLPQMQLYMERVFASGGEGRMAWLADEACYLLTGDAWYRWEPENPFAKAVGEQLSDSPARVGVGLAAGVFCFVAGLVSGLRRAGARPWLLAMLVCGPLAVAHAILGGRSLYPWYLVPCLPGVVLCLSAGVGVVAGRLPKLAGVVAGVVLVFLVWQPSGLRNRNLRAYPTEPLRESAQVYRRVLDPGAAGFGQEGLSAHLHMYTEAYDPAGRKVGSAAELGALMDEADRLGVPLYVNLSLPGLLAEAKPEVYALLSDPGKFEVAGRFWGLAQPCSRWVYRYLGGGG